MILVDYNSAMICSLLAGDGKTVKMDEDYIRHCFIERIRSIRQNYKFAYGDMVICCDGSNYWRKTYFPFYKIKRKQDRDNSYLDWTLIHKMLQEFQNDLIENFPYKVIRIEEAEADDVIAALAMHDITEERILIVSTDGDLCQLQSLPNVEVYSPRQSHFITIANPKLYLKEKIIRGDSGDGVPNILSDDNVFIDPDKRQGRIMTAKVQQWLNLEPSEFCSTETMSRNWKRNQILIDFDFIPEEIINKIRSEYRNSEITGNKNKMFQYLIDKQAVGFLSKLAEF